MQTPIPLAQNPTLPQPTQPLVIVVTANALNVVGTNGISSSFNTTNGAVSDFIQLLFARGGANKWRLGTNIDGTNVDAFQIRSEVAGGIVLSFASATGLLTLPFYGAGGGVVSVGAVDSGGAGFRLLRVPN